MTGDQAYFKEVAAAVVGLIIGHQQVFHLKNVKVPYFLGDRLQGLVGDFVEMLQPDDVCHGVKVRKSNKGNGDGCAIIKMHLSDRVDV